ncbi:MAG: ice-binding family protein, partial [Thermoplasmata archaeon]
SAATFGTTAVMKGTIMAYANITFATGASLEGRALARTESVTLDANTISLNTGATVIPYTVTLSSNPSAGGTTSGGGTFNSGSSVTVTATPNAGYTFTNWTENGIEVSTNASYQFTISGNRTLVVNFAAMQYTVTLSSNPAAGGTTSEGGTFNSGSSVTVTATPNAGYTFTNWTENGIAVSTNASYTFTISGNSTLVANFAAIVVQYTVTLSSIPALGGTTSGGGTFNSGSSVTVTATPNAGYTFTNWTENGIEVSTNASYTFTISGNRTLVVNFALAGAGSQAPVTLGSTSRFAILSYAGITNTGFTSITGDVGASPITGASMTGFETVALVGTIYVVGPAGPTGYVTNPALLTQAMLDLTTAYNDAAGRTVNPIGIAGNLGGQTLPPGLYKSTSSLEISSGDLTLNAKGDANAVWIFQIASSFNMTSGRQVFLIGGAKASNIFWQVGSAATFGTTAVMKGTIMAYANITFATGASLEGRALARTASVTLDANTISLNTGATASYAVTKPATVTSVENDVVPQAFSLDQNYPNPFNPSTKIQYTIGNAGLVSLKVYDVLGHEVATLVNSNQEAGSYTVPFNTSELNLSSGVYFYRLQAGSFVSIKKLILLK